MKAGNRLMQNYSGEDHVNIGWGKDVTIGDLAGTICDIAGLTGDISFDTSKPNGTPRKLMDSRKLHNMGWSPGIALEEGLREAHAWYVENKT